MDITTRYDNSNLMLMQFFGSSFPTGGFQHSYGLETYISCKLIKTADDMRKYLNDVILQNYVCFDGRAFCKAYDLVQKGSLEDVVGLDRKITALRITAESREASLKTGRAFARMASAVLDFEIFGHYYDRVKADRKTGNYCVVAGFICGLIKALSDTALHFFYYNDLNNLLQVGIKTIPLGQSEGQKVMYSLLDAISVAVNLTLERCEEEPESFTPYQNIMSMKHEVLYSRLYMS